jgi:hypothetical protein
LFKKVISFSLIILFVVLLANPVTANAAPVKEEQLEDSIVKAGNFLMSLQTDRGLWQAGIRVNPRETAYFMVTAKYLQIEDMENDLQTSAKWLLEHINKDGGWGFLMKAESQMFL